MQLQSDGAEQLPEPDQSQTWKSSLSAALMLWLSQAEQNIPLPLPGFPSWEAQNIFCQWFKECFRQELGSKGWVLSEKQYLRRWKVLCSEELVTFLCWSFSFLMLHWTQSRKAGSTGWDCLCLYKQAASIQNCLLMTHQTTLFVFSCRPADWEQLLDLSFLPGRLYKPFSVISCL